MLKKIMLLIMIVSLLLPYAVSASSDDILHLTDDSSMNIRPANKYSGNDGVTFIVEVEGDPVFASLGASGIGAASYAADQKVSQYENSILKSQTEIMNNINRTVKSGTEKGFTYGCP